MAAQAAHLLALALDLDPGNALARQELAATRTSQRRDPKAGSRSSLVEAAGEELRREAVDAVQFTGLARQLWRKGDDAGANDLLAVAKVKAPALPEVHRLLAAVAGEMGRRDEAAQELAYALRLDPFDGEAADQLSYLEEQCQRPDRALDAAIHAYLLLADLDAAKKGELTRRLSKFARRLGLSKAQLGDRFQARRELIETTTDRLRWRRDRFFEQPSGAQGNALFGPPPRKQRRGSLALALRLSQLQIFSELSEDDLFRLSAVVQEEIHPVGSLVASRAQPSQDVFLLERGEVRLERSHTLANLTVRTMAPGELFGEEGFLAGLPPSGDATASRASRLLRFDAEALRPLLAGSPALEARLLWVLWHALASKLRRSNEDLRRIFAQGNAPEPALRGSAAVALGERLEVDREATLRALAQRGLSRHELAMFAHFSEEKRFGPGDYLFREGDPGAELFALVEGKVVISKFIPGGGEEALTVLGPGELFGEMALLDGQPRSADARVEGGAATVLVLNRASIRGLFAHGAEESLEVLRLLGRLLARRLAELDEKIVLWRILTGTPGRELVAEELSLSSEG